MAYKKKARPVGRPKSEPQSAASIITKAREHMQQTRDLKQTTNHLEAEDTVARMMDESELKNIRDKDIKELKRQAEVLWELLQAERYEKEQSSYGTTQSDEDFLNAPAVQGQMTRAEWLKEHEHLKPKRKNARKVKSIRDIKEKHYEKYGLTTEVIETADIDALEKELENKLMDEAIAQRNEERRVNPLLNRRQRHQSLPNRQLPKKDFWI